MKYNNTKVRKTELQMKEKNKPQKEQMKKIGQLNWIREGEKKEEIY